MTRLRDAAEAASLGADLIGLNFYAGSPRCVSPRRARGIADRVRDRVRLVGVFVNAPEDTIRRLIDDLGLSFVQLHGDESPEFVRSFGGLAVKAFPLGSRADLARLALYPCPNFYLVDARSKIRGGSGRRANWTLAAKAASTFRVLLAGGLTPDNVAQAIAMVRPFGVDVASGVESAPGLKDVRKIEAFLRAARRAPTG